ncbi:hypothetical protein XFF1815_950001 [Xanthomonas citri pv. fuscans]|nr:hypothetical protein XFF7766_1220006 [Xanthomonas citri pv. fuscans]SOO46052.1 hypothetical protein XFF1815_950001 [Xanthomonas citri pv. fuscans]
MYQNQAHTGGCQVQQQLGKQFALMSNQLGQNS